MFKVIAVYRVPKLEDNYKNIHTPICLKVPEEIITKAQYENLRKYFSY